MRPCLERHHFLCKIEEFKYSPQSFGNFAAREGWTDDLLIATMEFH